MHWDTCKLSSLNDMTQSNLEKSRSVVLDARGAARFKGEVEEPRKGVRSGHIPGSINVPFQSLLVEDGSGLLDTDSLRNELHEAIPGGLGSSKPIIASCGSGVPSSIRAGGSAGRTTPCLAIL